MSINIIQGSMEIKELVLHPAQLVEVELSKVSCEKRDEYDSEKNELEIEIQVLPEVKGLENGNVRIDVLVKGEGFQIEVEEKGVFEFSGLENEKTISKFLEAQAIKILWSYVRESIYDLSVRMLRKPILIPIIDVIETLKKAEKDN